MSRQIRSKTREHAPLFLLLSMLGVSSSCSSSETLATCGNGVLDPHEICDGPQLGDQTCESLSLGRGTLRCNASCTAVVTDACIPLPTCSAPALRESGALDFDISTAAITGRLTLDGELLPPLEEKGELLFTRTDNGQSFSVPLSEEDGSYRVRVAVGTYDVSYRSANGQTYFAEGSTIPIAEDWNIAISGNRDFDVRTATISGRLTLDGVPFPSDQDPGELILTRGDNHQSFEVPLSSGEVSYRIRVALGAYDIAYRSSGSQEYFAEESVIPLVTDWNVTTSGIRDFDIPTATITGRVTLDGVAAFAGRGELMFMLHGANQSFRVSLASGDTYRVRLAQGTYDVSFRTTESQEDIAEGATVPLASGWTITASGNRDFDIQTATITGRLMLDDDTAHAVMGAGALIFTRSDNEQSFFVSLSSADSSYRVRVPHGHYEVSFQSPEDQTYFARGARVPLVTDWSITTSGNRDFDIRTAVVTGLLMLDGEAPPSAPDAGDLVFATGDGASFLVPLSDMDSSYRVRLAHGTYDVSFRSSDSDATLAEGTIVPLTEDWNIATSGNRDFDIPTLTITGRITLDGAAAPSGIEIGELVFGRRENQAGARVPLSADGATYRARIAKGGYDVSFRSLTWQEFVAADMTVPLRSFCDR